MITKDHSELNGTPELDENGIKQCQSLIGTLQLLVTLAGYHIAPREGHLERLKQIIGHVKKHPDGVIRFQPNIPDHSYSQEI
jgi:hypothetical protein